MGASTQMSFCPRTLNFQVRVSKFPKLGFLWFWTPMTLCVDLRLRWGLKQSCSPCQKLFNHMWQIICTHGNWSDSQLLVVRSQIDNLTPSFAHNLCFRYPNGSWEPILNIYVPRAFQWYRELFNPMSFDPWNRLLNFRKSIGTPTLKMGAHLGV
jgi:hypothetical protein